ncbi:signalosome complex subunit 6 [Seminavis robusta]|uniref:Signalosome complex subunit 6 n=1 Tax=Seminavis robusta TaxID=568900 RepID=A0A9N8ETB4_9STRA|nr:signalosome complex subunit 6 [Seminavis robusta]|eukprot:Sro2062_g313080.1 signalosome complex subunit 6 (356) ;mRNA; r:13663-15317
MASTMEVDAPKEEEAKQKVSVHPLAIVNMSDQYTRITCGGSALSKDDPVVGLLFGQMIKTEDDLSILKVVDADDIPTDRSETAKTQISLHHAVFPLHDVVGWYRVGNSEEPTANDLRLTQELKAHYQKPDQPFFFSLLHVRSSPNNNNGNNNKEKDDMKNDDELPLNLYEIQNIHDASEVLVGVDNWSLETSEAERIAVERVVREQPQQDIKASNNSNDTNNEELPTQASPYVNYMTSVEHSLQAMQDRIKVIMDYLESMGKGEIPPNPSLMRQIEGLILQLGPLQASLESNSNNRNSQDNPYQLQQSMSDEDAELFSHLAAVAKAVQSVHSYTEKFRTLHENRPTGGREGRRGY